MKTGDKVLRTVLIGLGMVADTHLNALADLRDHFRLDGVFSRTPETMTAFAGKAHSAIGHSPKAVQSMDELVNASYDVAIVATPPNARQEIVAHLAGEGIHILMEKPIERDLAAAVEIVDLCRRANVTLGIVFQHRVRAASQKALEMVQSGFLGELGLVEVNVPWWREQSYYDEPGRGTYARDGGGVLISQAIHTLDLMLSLTGPVSEVQAMAATTRFHSMEAEDFVSAGMKFVNGAVGSLSASTASYPGGAEYIRMHFEKAVFLLQSGKITIDWRDGRTKTIGADAATGGGADPMAFTHDWHTDIMRDFHQAVCEKRPPIASGEESLKVHRLIDALNRSSAAKKVVKLQED